MSHLLLVEDEPDVASFIQQGLQEEGYQVTWVDTGHKALEVVQPPALRPDLILLDLRLPDLSGLVVCRKLRALYNHLPIMMLTALDAVEDKVIGLRAGADDYLPKPFAFAELLARIEALLRRTTRHTEMIPNKQGDLLLDPVAHTCSYQNHTIALTPKEFDLLAYFMTYPGQALSRETIHHDVWGHDFDRGTNLINVYVNYVRYKLREASCPATIETVRGVGYRFVS